MATTNQSPAFVWNCETHEYDADTIRVRATSLEDFHDSPKAYYRMYVAKTMQKEETKALRVGIMAHCALFEPERWKKEYTTEPSIDRRTNSGKEDWATFCAESAGLIVADGKEYALASNIVAAVRASKEAMKYLDCDGPQEQSICWQDHETMLECKSRRDKVIESGRLRSIICLKTAQDVSEHGFAGAVARFGYHRKAAFYLSGQEALTGDEWPFVWIAAQNKEPFEVCVYHASEDFLTIGRRDMRRDMDALATCIETDDWRATREKQTSVLPPPTWLAYESQWTAQ